MQQPLFKPWVPNWLAILTIFCILFPSLVIFALYYNSTLAVSEYYSMDAMDVQYSVVIMYATVISYLALDSHLVKCFRIGSYTISGIFINTITCLICAKTQSCEIFMFCRFIQGGVCAYLCNICMNLAFTRFNARKARVMGYTIFYGSLMTCVPFSAIFANWILNYFGVESVFYGFILFQIPGFILLFLTMNNRYLSRKFPLSQIDWTGFIIYTAIVSIAGYILVYGQQLEWLESPRICNLIIILVVITPVYVVSSLRKKRPLIQLRLLKNGKYRLALFLLTMFYISKGTTFFTYLYMQNVLGIDSVSMVTIWWFNIFGLIVGIFTVSKLLLKGVMPRTIIKLGFFTLLIFHTQMFFQFAGTASEEQYYLPLFVQGVGTGSLFVPLIMNMVMSVPPKQAGLVAFLGIAARYTGFCLAIALINFFQLYGTNRNYMDMATTYTLSNEIVNNTREETIDKYIGAGYTYTDAARIADESMTDAMKNESSIRAYMNYYSFIILALLLLLVYLSFDKLPSGKRIKERARLHHLLVLTRSLWKKSNNQYIKSYNCPTNTGSHSYNTDVSDKDACD